MVTIADKRAGPVTKLSNVFQIHRTIFQLQNLPQCDFHRPAGPAAIKHCRLKSKSLGELGGTSSFDNAPPVQSRCQLLQLNCQRSIPAKACDRRRKFSLNCPQ
jgi:hypothetical protein